MRIWKVTLSLLLTMLVSIGVLGGANSYAASGVQLFTPFTDISVTPGQTVSYSIDVINSTASIQEVPISLQGVPPQWKSQLSYGSWLVKKVAVKPNDTKTVNLDIDVPLAVDKGSYNFEVLAGDYKLPLTINVSEQGTYKTELSVNQPNMQGHADANFNFSADLKNKTANKQDYALSAEAPAGWDVAFSSLGKNVTSVSVDQNSSQTVNIDITPPTTVKAGTYKIPIHAATNASSADSELEVVITGTYGLDLTTSSGLLSADITAGSDKKIDLQLTNKGSTDLKDIELSATTPANWEVTFDEKKIPKLDAGKSTTVTATVKADSKAIAGDYQLNMHAQTPEVSSDAQFRITVKTSMLWGWVGILLILMVVVVIYYLFRAYGRR